MDDARTYWARPCSAVVMLLVFMGPVVGMIPGAARGTKHARPSRIASRAPSSLSDAGALAVERPAKEATVPATRPKPTAADPHRGDLFRGFGAWIDLYDLKLKPRTTIGLLRRWGVKTLFIQTGRANTKHHVVPNVGHWLVLAHRAGIRVVGWYLPYYKDLRVDVRRTLAIARFRYHGHRFDGLGIDIEWRKSVRSRTVWNRRVAQHAAAVRRALGPRYPIAAIPPPPLQMRVAPRHWAGFPWKPLSSAVDSMMLMSYWSDRRGCPHIVSHCAYNYTVLNARLTRKLTRSDMVIHMIGGVADRVTLEQMAGFVRGCFKGHADGCSVYDVGTTKRTWWSLLSRLRSLGAPAAA